MKYVNIRKYVALSLGKKDSAELIWAHREIISESCYPN